MFLTKTETINKHVFTTGINVQNLPFDSITSVSNFSSNRYDRFLKNCEDNAFIVEIKKPENLHILEIMDCALSNVIGFLDERHAGRYGLKLYLSQDIEIPDWRQFTIHVASQMDGYDQKEELWDQLITIFDKSYHEYLQRVKKLVETEHEKEAYRMISIIVD